MPSQVDKNNELLKKILEMLETQRKDIQIIKQDILYIKKKIPEPEKISTGWLW
jgi:hypothetical protein